MMTPPVNLYCIPTPNCGLSAAQNWILVTGVVITDTLVQEEDAQAIQAEEGTLGNTIQLCPI
jgi:hypothetical protein